MRRKSDGNEIVPSIYTFVCIWGLYPFVCVYEAGAVCYDGLYNMATVLRGNLAVSHILHEYYYVIVFDKVLAILDWDR